HGAGIATVRHRVLVADRGHRRVRRDRRPVGDRDERAVAVDRAPDVLAHRGAVASPVPGELDVRAVDRHADGGRGTAELDVAAYRAGESPTRGARRSTTRAAHRSPISGTLALPRSPARTIRTRRTMRPSAGL